MFKKKNQQTGPAEKQSLQAEEQFQPGEEQLTVPDEEKQQESVEENLMNPDNGEILESDEEHPENEQVESETTDVEPTAVEAAYCLGAGIDAKTFTKAKALLRELASEADSAGFNPQMIQMAIRLLNYEQTIENARKEGMEAGRREKIAEAFRNKRSAAAEADAIPHLHGTKNSGSTRSNTIFDVARDAR